MCRTTSAASVPPAAPTGEGDPVGCLALAHALCPPKAAPRSATGPRALYDGPPVLGEVWRRSAEQGWSSRSSADDHGPEAPNLRKWGLRAVGEGGEREAIRLAARN